MIWKKVYIAAALLGFWALAPALSGAESIRFAVVGDTQGSGGPAVSEEAFKRVIELTLAADPPVQFVIQVGDLVSGGAWYGQEMLEQFQLWRSIAAPWYTSDFLGLKVYPVPGNHDQTNPVNYLDAWQQAFPELPDNGPRDEKKSTYSFDLGSCHFTAVNTSAPSWLGYHAVDTHWLAKDLAASNQPIKFVFGHDPAFPSGRHVGSSLDARPERRDIFWQTLAENNVKAYFCGHEHTYDHWIENGIHQIIAGTPYLIYIIVDVDDDNSVTVSVYNANDNSLMDQFNLADTAKVSGEDRTGVEDPFYSFIDNVPCLLITIFLAGFGYIGFNLTTGGTYRYE